MCDDIQETGMVALARKPVGIRWYCRCILRHWNGVGPPLGRAVIPNVRGKVSFRVSLGSKMYLLSEPYKVWLA